MQRYITSKEQNIPLSNIKKKKKKKEKKKKKKEKKNIQLRYQIVASKKNWTKSDCVPLLFFEHEICVFYNFSLFLYKCFYKVSIKFRLWLQCEFCYKCLNAIIIKCCSYINIFMLKYPLSNFHDNNWTDWSLIICLNPTSSLLNPKTIICWSPKVTAEVPTGHTFIIVLVCLK